MGTGKCGRYLNSQGSGTEVSDFSLIHSLEGTFTYDTKTHRLLNLKSGGHGEASIKILKKEKIQFNIIKVLANGVRIGNIPNHKNPKKRVGLNQAWFPEKWTAKDIKKAGQHVANLKCNRHAPDGKALFGVYKGVRVGIIKTHGKIATVFPDSNQNVVLKRKGKKHGF